MFKSFLYCYGPADFALLLEGTGLALEGIDLDGTLLPLGQLGITGAGLLPGHLTESAGSDPLGICWKPGVI